MLINTNYHTHSQFCDGKGKMEEYVISAIEKKMTCLGFSGHSPVPIPSSWNMKLEDLPAYLNEASRLKSTYSDQIQIYSGLEFDYIEHQSSLSNDELLQLDYFIGSIHYIGQFDDGRYFNYDESASCFDLGLQQIFGGDIRKLVFSYYEQVCKMIETYRPPLIGHIDLIKKFNTGDRYFNENEKWFTDAALPALELIKKHELIVEINTKGYARRTCDTFYPSPGILRDCHQMGIALTYSADAHSPEEVASHRESVELMLRYLDVKTVRILKDNQWQDINL